MSTANGPWQQVVASNSPRRNNVQKRHSLLFISFLKVLVSFLEASAASLHLLFSHSFGTVLSLDLWQVVLEMLFRVL